MKKLALILVVALLSLAFISSCIDIDEAYEENQKKQEEYNKLVEDQFTTDTTLIVKYIADSSLVAQVDTTYGFYYVIEELGDENHPTTSSYIEVKYKGYLLDGTVFYETEENATISSSLSSLISGWQIGLPLIGEGGKIKLILPSYYAYGMYDYGSIPSNSVVIFDIELVSFY
jgi:FKBP-type peptidyl-prolyl cis-trans isomerase FkpA